MRSWGAPLRATASRAGVYSPREGDNCTFHFILFARDFVCLIFFPWQSAAVQYLSAVPLELVFSLGLFWTLVGCVFCTAHGLDVSLIPLVIISHP